MNWALLELRNPAQSAWLRSTSEEQPSQSTDDLTRLARQMAQAWLDLIFCRFLQDGTEEDIEGALNRWVCLVQYVVPVSVVAVGIYPGADGEI